MKQLFYPPPIRQLMMVFMLLFAGNTFLLAEGSVDFRGYPGNRLFYNVEQDQQLKVYANAGEFINVGSSHVGINGGTIAVYGPDGTLIETFNGNDGSAIIFNHFQEDQGPIGGTIGINGTEGYTPGVVTAGQSGIYTVKLLYPEPFALGFVSNLLNSDNWNRDDHQPQGGQFPAQHQRVALAWDVTVSQGAAGDAGGNLVTGRLYSNEYISILDGNDGANGPRSTSPTFFVLTRAGYLYQVNFSDTDPWGFPIYSNSLGLVKGDFMPTYMSGNIGADVFNQANGESTYVRSAAPDTWAPETTYLYEPQAQDSGPISNNKIFFNMPDPSLPTSAMVTDVARANIHTTWLLNEIPSLDNAQPFTFQGILPANGSCQGELVAEEGEGGNFVFDSELEGQAVLRIDVNNNGTFTDAVDVTINKNVRFGLDSIFWNGIDGTGTVIPANPNFNFNYQLTVRGGEIHLLLEDIENNSGGVTFSRLNGPGSPANSFNYDHSEIGGATSGGVAGNPQPTTVPFTYTDGFGNEKLLDQWAFIETSNFGTGTLAINIEEECSPGDHDNDGIPDIVDIDDDNDGVPDLLEYCHPTEGFACLPNGLDPSGDEDGDGVQNFEDANDAAVGNTCTDSNNDGVCDQIAAIYDTDGDNVPDHFDLDSDNDGISDLVEAGHGQPDVDGNGVIDGENAVFGANGFYVSLETSDAQDAVANYVPWDFDGDGIPDHDDLDSDNDGILDVVEAGYVNSDSNQDGRIDDGNGNVPAVDGNGLVPLIDPDVTGVGIPLPIDWDSDGIPDWHDLDSDNDGILDVIEGGYQGNDTNLDGRIDDGSGNIPSVNSDGLPPVMQNGPITRPPDTDTDGVRDWHDLDSDNDGINDTVENTNPDGDGDGFIGTGPITVDANGVAIADANGNLTPVTPLVNTDNDGPADFRDLEADGDGLNDVDEGGLADDDRDGIIGTSTPTVNQFGQATGVTSNPTDTDNDGTPDFQQVDQECEAPATPTLSASATQICEGEPVTFTATGVTPAADISYVWTTTNANGTTEVTTVVPTLTLDPTVASNAGTYTVIALKDTCASVVSNGVVLNITPKPDAPVLSVDDDIHCEGDRLEFTATPVAGTNVLYEFTFTNPEGRVDPLVTTSQPSAVIEQLVAANTGTYQVRAIVDGCPSDFSNDVPINVASGGLPDVTATSSAPAENPACEGDDVTLSVTPVDGATYEWSGPNGVVGTTAAVVLEDATAAAANGEYSVTITVNDCPKTVGPVTVQVDPKPATPTLSVDNAAVCPGEGFTLTTDAVAGDNITYDWLLNGTLVTSTNEPSLVVAAPTEADAGSYTVVVRDGGCPSDPSNAIDVTIQPPLEGGITSDPAGGVCEGESITLTAPSAEGATYEWTGPNGFTSSEVAITLENVSPADNGDYSVVVTVNGCPNNFGPTTLEINAKPATPTISTDKDSACPGEAVTLSTTAATGDAITYDWILNGTVVATTDNPTFEISDFQEENAGDYTVVVKDGSCPSDPSDPAVSISLSEGLEGVSASSNSPVCIGDPINLTVTDVEGATYAWTGPNGFTSAEQNPTIESATAANAGDYEVVVTVDGCPATIPPTTVEVTPKPDAPVVEIAEENVCEGTAGVINVTSPNPIPDGTTFTALDAAGAAVGTSTTGSIEVPTDGLDGIQFYTVISQVDGGCPSEPSEAVTINVTPKPTEEAMINTPPDGGDPCGMAPMALEGNTPTEGTGAWTSSNADVVFVDPNSPTTDVMGLEDGDMVTWTLANEACGEYSSASITIIAMPPMTTANDDAFTVESGQPASGSVIGNDTPNNGTVTVISGPSNGTGTIDANGNLSYTPNAGFAGDDQIVYELCNADCPDAPCDQATVTITVNPNPDCTVPDVISPNGDGLNDALVIPCSDFQNVGLKIFNRWGDLVFETDNYNNNWDGTHDGADLPPGPYYYIFEENGVEPTTGCVSIAR